MTSIYLILCHSLVYFVLDFVCFVSPPSLCSTLHCAKGIIRRGKWHGEIVARLTAVARSRKNILHIVIGELSYLSMLQHVWINPIEVIVLRRLGIAGGMVVC